MKAVEERVDGEVSVDRRRLATCRAIQPPRLPRALRHRDEHVCDVGLVSCGRRVDAPPRAGGEHPDRAASPPPWTGIGSAKGRETSPPTGPGSRTNIGWIGSHRPARRIVPSGAGRSDGAGESPRRTSPGRDRPCEKLVDRGGGGCASRATRRVVNPATPSSAHARPRAGVVAQRRCSLLRALLAGVGCSAATQAGARRRRRRRDGCGSNAGACSRARSLSQWTPRSGTSAPAAAGRHPAAAGTTRSGAQRRPHRRGVSRR